jgi:type IV secretion system protein VirB9
LLVVTDRRTYVFSLQKAKKGEPVTWLLRFDYPDTRAREREQRRVDEIRRAQEQQALTRATAARQVAARQAEQDAEPAPIPSDPPLRNEAYSMRGDRQLAPTELWDDGRFTYFRYAAGDLPRVFQVLQDGEESLANFHMSGDTIVVHAVAQGFVVRLGAAVLGIRNDAYAPAAFNASGTGSGTQSATRLLKRVKEGAGQ